MHENKKILVVGAGALGVTTAYHLRQSGADISFYVRPGRAEQLQKPLRLYAYHKRAVDELADFDGNSLGPYKKGDVVNLSPQVADILIESSKAQIVLED